MKKGEIKESLGFIVLPFLFVLILLPNSLRGWFGLADDHHFIEAYDSAQGNLQGIFDYFFQLQPWGDTTRFNPSQLLAWSLETTLFGDKAILWRTLQLIAVFTAVYAIGRSTYLGLSLFLPNFPRKRVLAISFQGIFLSLPFLGESIARIGNPETFAATTLSLLILFHLKQFQNSNSLKYSWLIALLNIILVGFKENLFPLGLISLLLQVLYLLRCDSIKGRISQIAPLLFQLFYFVFFIMAFVPTLLGQGQDIYGNEIGINRFSIGKWIILPTASLFLFVLNIIKRRDSLLGLLLQIVCVFLVFLDYFIMGGKLSGHYGFVTGFVLMCQLLFFLAATDFLGKNLLYFLIPAISIGITTNGIFTMEYLNSTRVFKNEISELRQKIASGEGSDVVIIIRSLDEYEAVSSTTSFARSPKTKFYLKNEREFEENILSNHLRDAETAGNKIWHILPSSSRKITTSCIEVYFSKSEIKKTCDQSVFVSWLK